MKANYIINTGTNISEYLTKNFIENDPNLYGQYTIVSANLTNYLPEIDSSDHMDIFIRLLTHKKLSKLEQGDLEALKRLTVEGFSDTVHTALTKGGIISTFHTGSYRMVNLFLAKNNIPFTLVIGQAIIEQEGNEYISIFQDLFKDSNSDHFRIVDAESRSSGLRILRELKEGRILLLYMDGNSGAGMETAANENHCAIDFLGQQLFARKGIGHLAYIADVPILPVISYRPAWNDIRIKFSEPILPNRAIEREGFSLTVTQHLYNQASLIIRDYPEQWESWLSLHRIAKISRQSPLPAITTSGNIATFNLRHFGLFQIGKESFLLRKSLYQSYAIKCSLFQQLKRSIGQPVNIDDFEPEIWDELIENRVLICVA